MVGDTAVITNPGADERKPETDGTAATLTELGYPVSRITGGTLDGGDVLKVGTTIYVGRTLRTTRPASPRSGGSANRSGTP